MSKPTLVTLPFLLLLLDFWPLQRLALPPGRELWRLLREKLPFLALSAASCAVTLAVQTRGGAVRPFDYLPLGPRLANAALAYLSYLGKTVWPVDLAVIYPLPRQLPEWQVTAAVLLLAALTLGALLARRRRYLLVGWLWFLGLLVPMLGLVQVGDAAMADRYTYLPLVGLFLGLTWGLAELWPRWPRRRFAFGLGMLAVLSACAALTSRQLALWQNTERLMRHALAVTRENYLAYNQLGTYYWAHNRTADTIENYRKSLAIVPRVDSFNNLGLALARQNDYTNAIAQYIIALQAAPEEVAIRLNLADALFALGRLDETVVQYKAALHFRPNDPAIHHELALNLFRQGHRDEAIEHDLTAVRLQPDFPEARNTAAMLLAQAGRLDDAIAQSQAVLRTHPNDLEAHNNLGIVYNLQGKLDAASAQFYEVLRLNTNFASAYVNLGNALAGQKQIVPALEAFRQFIRYMPEDPRGHQGLGRGWLEQGRLEDALAEFNTALRLQPDNPELYYFLGLIRQRQGKTEDARTCYRRALGLQPDFPEAQRQLDALAAPAQQ